MSGEEGVYVAGGVESISMVQSRLNEENTRDEWLEVHRPELYWSMLQTAEYVAKRYNISPRGTGSLRRRQPAQGGCRQSRRPLRCGDRADRDADRVVDKETAPSESST